MNFKSSLLLLFLLLATCSNSFAQKISHDELVEILGIKSWRVPTPKDDNSTWNIRIVNYENRSPSDATTEKLDFQNNGLLVLREARKNTFESFFKLRQGTSRGEFEIDICSSNAMTSNRCDNKYAIEWYALPMPYGDGLRCVIADIKNDSNKPVKQIILELAPSKPVTSSP